MGNIDAPGQVQEKAMGSTTIVVPCYNEARRLDAARFERFASAHGGMRFLLVNDGSRDETLSVLERMRRASSSQIEVLNLEPNGGKAEAIRRGMLHAALRRPDFIGFWDADLATPLEAIPAFVAVLERRAEIALVVGARMPLLGHAIRRRWARRVLGRAFARVASLALGARIYDTQCGAKLFRATPEVLAALAAPLQSRWIFDVEILARLVHLRRGMSKSRLSEFVYELPLDQWEDVAGSKLKKGDFVKAVGELAAIWWRYLRPGAAGYAPSVSERDLPTTEKRRAA